MYITSVTAEKQIMIFKYIHYNAGIWKLVSYHFSKLLMTLETLISSRSFLRSEKPKESIQSKEKWFQKM